MKNVLLPALSILNRLSFPKKFGLILLVFMVPLVGLSFVYISSINQNITTLKNEYAGVDYIKAIRLPLQHIQQHRGMTSAYLNGGKDFYEKIIEKRKTVDAHLAELAKIDEQLGEDFKTENLIDEILSLWDTVKKESLQDISEDAFAKHNNLVDKLLDLKVHVAAYSQITLDPVVDSYYLGMSIVVNLPFLIDTMGKARAFSASIAARGSFTSDSFIKLSIANSNVNTYTRNMVSGLNNSLEHNVALAEKIGDNINQNNQAIEEFRDLLRQEFLEQDKINISSEKTFSIATDAITKSYALFDVIAPELQDLFKLRIAKQTQRKYAIVTMVFLVMVLAIYCFIALYLSIKENIYLVGNAVKDISEGKLYTRLTLDTKDEMQQISVDINSMTDNFSKLVDNIANSTNSLSVAAEQYSALAKTSATNLNNQNRETEQVATAMNEMSATVTEVARSANEAAKAAENADNEASTGKHIVHDTTDSISSLAGEVENVSNVIEKLAAESEDIGGVLDVIKSIAEQTNLLALNAAIEAARAGEQGRGFAVVADEVRTLASRTQDSTKEIEKMIADLQAGASNAVTVMNSGRATAQKGVEHSHNAANALMSITDAVGVINQMNAQIANASDEQRLTAEEMNRNIVNISQLTEETLGTINETTSASEELASMALELKSLITQFKLTA